MRRASAPTLDRFGGAEAQRLIIVCATLAASVVRALLRRLVRRRTLSWAEAVAVGIVDGFMTLGPTFVKFGQLIASAPGVFTTVLADASLRCLDDVPPFDAVTARRIIEHDLGRPPEAIFSSFDPVPLSAGSVAQVHACTLTDGRSAVLKLQRPGIHHRMALDLRILYRLSRVASRHSALARSANLPGAVEDLHARTFEELDFALEVRRQDRFLASIRVFPDNAHVTAPEVFWPYCGPHVICMERLSGVPLDDFDELRRRGVSGEVALRRIVKVWIEATLIHGRFHGDVHAGNIWLLDDGRAAFLDFGIMGELDDAWKQLYRNLFRATAIDGDFARVATSFKQVGAFPDHGGSDDEIGAALLATFGPILETGLAAISVGGLLRSIVEFLDSYTGGTGTPRELVLIMKQLLYFERYSKALAPDWSLATDLFLLRNVFPEDVAKRSCDGAGTPGPTVLMPRAG